MPDATVCTFTPAAAGASAKAFFDWASSTTKATKVKYADPGSLGLRHCCGSFAESREPPDEDHFEQCRLGREVPEYCADRDPCRAISWVGAPIPHTHDRRTPAIRSHSSGYIRAAPPSPRHIAEGRLRRRCLRASRSCGVRYRPSLATERRSPGRTQSGRRALASRGSPATPFPRRRSCREASARRSRLPDRSSRV
jgi:hypothetical protein